jgi:hypothetical protein
MGGSVDNTVFIPISTAQRKLFGGRATSGTSWKVSSINVALAKRSLGSYVSGTRSGPAMTTTFR